MTTGNPGGMLANTWWRLHPQREPAVGQPGHRHVVWLPGVAEGYVPSSQSLTKHGPLEKGIAHHFSILAFRIPWIQWEGKKIWPVIWPSLKRLRVINAGEGVVKRETSCTVGGNVNWCSLYGKTVLRFLKKLNIVTSCSSNPTPEAYTWGKP